MNGNKATLNDVYYMLGDLKGNIKNIHNSCDSIKKKMEEGDKKFEGMQKQIQSNTTQIRFIYSGIGIIVTAIITTVLKLWNSLWR